MSAERAPRGDADGWASAVGAAYWVAVALLAAVVLLAGVRSLVGDWIPTGDDAFLAMRSRAVFSAHPPLLSTASSAGAEASATYNHPGPAVLWLAAPVTALFGSRGIGAAVAALNAGAVVGIGAMARRAARPALAAGVLAAIAGVVWAMGSEVLVDPWNPHAATLPFAALLVASWAVWCSVRWAAVVGLFAGAVAAQTHLSFAPVSAAVCAGLLVGLVVAARATGDSSQRRRWLVAGGVAGAAAVVALLPSLVEQLAHGGDGNLARIARGSSLDSVTVSASQAVSVVGSVVARPPFFLRGSWDLPRFDAELLSPLVAAALLALVAAWSAATLLAARRRGDRQVLPLLVLPCVAIAVGAVSSTAFPLRLGIPVPYFRWLWPAAALLAAALVVPLLERVARAVQPPRWPATRVVAGLGVGAALVASLLTVPAHGSGQAASEPWGQELTRQVLDQAGPRLRALDAVTVVPSLQEGPLMAFTPALVDRLDEWGVDVRSADPVIVQQSGAHHRATGSEPWVLVMVGPDTSQDAGPAGGERLAVHRALDPAAARELERDVRQVVGQLEGASLVLTDGGRHVRDPALDGLEGPVDDPEALLHDRVLATALRNDLAELVGPDGSTIEPEHVADVSERAFHAAGRTFALWLVPREDWEAAR